MATPLEYLASVFGPGGTGRSAITVRWIANHFAGEYDPGIEDIYRKQITLNGQAVILNVNDTASREGPQMFSPFMMTITPTVAVFVYAIDDLHSFREVMIAIPKLREKWAEAPILVIGNKTDLEEKRQVPFQEAQEQLKPLDVTLMECSCKTGENTKECFDVLLKLIASVPHRHMVRPKMKSGCVLY